MPFRSARLPSIHGMGRNIGGAYNTANEWSVPPMPATVSVPDSLSSLLRRFRSCFTAPGYEVFTAMFTGFILRPVERTVCGMLTGAGLAGIWHHSRAHRFFSGTRWDVGEVGLILAALVVEILLPPDAAIMLAIDETLTRRRGPKVFAASGGSSISTTSAARIMPTCRTSQRVAEKNRWAREWCHTPARPAPVSIPHTVRSTGRRMKPVNIAVNTSYPGAV